MFDAIKNWFQPAQAPIENKWDGNTVTMQQPNSPEAMNQTITEQPSGPEGMSVHMRGGDGGDICCGICAGLCCFECCECCCCCCGPPGPPGPPGPGGPGGW